MFIVTLIWFILIHRIYGVSNIFGDVNNEYLHKILRNTKSSEMANYLNVSCDPCTNFYNFACGNYKRINPPNDFTTNNVFQDLSDGMHRKFLQLIKPDEATDTLTDMKVKNFYESCVNLAILRNTYRSKLREIINEFGHMPALEGDNWRDSNYFDWLKTIAEINRKYGMEIILGCSVHSDLTNKRMYSLYIATQDMSLGSVSAYTDEAQAEARHIRKLNIAYNLKYIFGLRTSEAEKTASEIFQFEADLFVGYKGQRINTNLTLNFDSSADGELLTIENLQTKYDSHLDMRRLINITIGYLPNNHVFDFIEPLAVNIINAVQLTPDRIVANYIFYNLIEKFMLIRDPAARNLENFMTLTSPKWKQQLQKVCIVETEKYFGQFLNNMVYRKYMTNQTEQNLKTLWETSKLAFRDILDSNTSPSPPGMMGFRKIAVDKLQAMRLELSSYEDIDFAKEYNDFSTISKHDYVENIKTILISKAVNARANLNKTSSKFKMDDIFSIYPKYNPLDNVIIIPVSLLQPYYLWSQSYPKALKYGTVGFLIARQIIHALGEQFIHFDKSGNLIEIDANVSNYFSHISQCFEVQYHNYYLDGQPLSKLESQLENIADSGGIRLAYSAYMKWYTLSSQQNSTQEHLPNLRFTSQQLFFISFGQLLCSAGNDLTKSVNSFAVDAYRINQALSNLNDFSKVFKCPGSSGMNPLTKCKIY